MSQENVEIVRAIYDALNREDWDATFRNVDADCEFTMDRGPDEGTHRGRQRVQAVLQDLWAAFDAMVVEPERLIESDDHIVVIFRTRLRPKGTSAEFEIRNGHLWTIRDGVVVSMRNFAEPEKALEAIGLSEQEANADC